MMEMVKEEGEGEGEGEGGEPGDEIFRTNSEMANGVKATTLIPPLRKRKYFSDIM